MFEFYLVGWIYYQSKSQKKWHTRFPVGAGRGELLRDDLGDVVGPARRAGVDVGEGARHAVRGEAGVVADRPRVRVVAATALEMQAGRGKRKGWFHSVALYLDFVGGIAAMSTHPSSLPFPFDGAGPQDWVRNEILRSKAKAYKRHE